MSYQSLYKMFYIDKEIFKKEYENRFNSPYAVYLDLKIKENQAFFCPTVDIYKKIVSIQRADKRINHLCSDLPEPAIHHFAVRCLIDEIVLTNKIEGVHSTRKEIAEVFESLSDNKNKRFHGLVNKYALLMLNKNIPFNRSSDIRKVYDDIFLNEIKDNNKSSLPDGDIFRKDSVSVYSVTGKELHCGLIPESKIIETMDKALEFLNNDKIDVFFRIAVFHYLFGYIHPFYDGNGRTSRFISSYLLSHELNHIIGYRISFTIKEHINNYYEAFKICNHQNNKGDLTPFIDMFLDIIVESMRQLDKALTERNDKLNYYKKSIANLPGGADKKLISLYRILIQASLFSNAGMSTKDIAKSIKCSVSTIHNKLSLIPEKLLVKEKVGRYLYYSLNLEEADKYIA